MFILKGGASSNHQKNQNYGQCVFDIKTSINLLIPEKLGPKNEIYYQCYEIWDSEQVKFLKLKYDLENYGSCLKLGRFGLKIAMCSNFYEIWHLVQIEHPNYEYGTWN